MVASINRCSRLRADHSPTRCSNTPSDWPTSTPHRRLRRLCMGAVSTRLRRQRPADLAEITHGTIDGRGPRRFLLASTGASLRGLVRGPFRSDALVADPKGGHQPPGVTPPVNRPLPGLGQHRHRAVGPIHPRGKASSTCNVAGTTPMTHRLHHLDHPGDLCAGLGVAHV